MIESLKKLDTYSLIVFLLIFVSDETFTFGSYGNVFLNNLKYFIYFIVFLFLLSQSKINYLNKNVIFLSIFSFFIPLVLSMLANKDFSLGYFYRVFLFLFTLSFVQRVTFENFAKIFVRIVYFLALSSLIVFLINMLSPSILSFFPKQYSKTGAIYTNLFFCTILDSGRRNASIFREPGVFMIYILFALIIEFFFFKKINKKHIVGFYFALLTTFSTAGYILGALLLLLYLIKEEKSFEKGKIFIVLLLILIIVFIYIFPFIIDTVYLNKFSGDYLGKGSTLARLASLVVPLLIWLKSPIFGVGFNDITLLFSKYSYYYFDIFLSKYEITNTLTLFFAIFGAFVGIFYVYSLYKLTYYFSKKNITRILLFIVLIGMLGNENMPYSVFINILFAYGIIFNEKVFKNIVINNGNSM